MVKRCTGTPCPWGGMKCIFSGTGIGMPGNDALRLAMNSDVPCSVDRLQMVICVPIVMHVCRALYSLACYSNH